MGAAGNGAGTAGAVTVGAGGTSGAAGAGANDAVAGEVVLELRHATKAFGAALALGDGSVVLRAGEAHALLGENGAGKSTLVKILAGVHQPDSGELLVAGREVTLHGPAAAKAAGIAVIYQEPMLFPDLTVAENIFMGRQPVRPGRRIDRGAMNRAAAGIFAQLGVLLDPARPARGLSVADQQIVEIAKALSLDARVLVMDEPTAALTNVEVERLFDGHVRAAAAGDLGHVHLAPAGRGVRELPAGDDHAGRQVRARRPPPRRLTSTPSSAR